MNAIFNLFAILIGGYTVANTLNLLLWSVGGLFGHADDVPIDSPPKTFRRILVLIPAYKEDTVIIDSVKANLKQNYPSDLYDLVVIADSFQPHTINQLKEMPIKVVEVSFAVSSVSKALNAALMHFPVGSYDIAVVADADNHMAPDFLTRINAAFEGGWRAVQGHRIAKNLNTSVAILDAISEEVNNHIFRKGHRAFGFSSTLIGSGMAFELPLLKKYLSQIQTIGGYDKDLEMRLLKNKIAIGYLENAFIFDEKVQTSGMFERQRTRWVESQINQARLHLVQGIREGVNQNFDYVEKAIQTLALPRILLLGTITCSLIISLLLHKTWFAELMGVQLLLFLITLTIALPGYLRRLIGINELLMVPILFFRFVRSVINFRQARGRFLHTTHGTDSEVIV
ncbi:glycosyltransferase family 2 protein [Spirosoma fluviale]|uniref:Glycosyltransferase, catalytic subunit of cellulose synthase and poly-beta-1,6-N-acetylglucosamine synthase n=1 Tax=Spirosoma fluviale TaxID=1597977 RepID=A0A286GC93_9BACT|nr:glycosyltransferase family 2 protein [Spirosoma fluviale]SOD93132.1 Glycosyltransferase, catalytic subunit of cellulose synthase and poly-beta-1,6-N-acetylglucosamine synthase [Spirosoma fluviale]